MLELLYIVLGLVVGAVLSILLKRYQDQVQKRSSKLEAERILNKAKSEAARLEKDAKNRSKDFEVRARKNVEQDIQKQKNQLKQKESQLDRKLKELDEQNKRLLTEAQKQEQNLKQKEEKIDHNLLRLEEQDQKLSEQLSELKSKLVQVSHMSEQEARQELLKSVQEEAKMDAAKLVQKIEEDAKNEADRMAKRVLAQALARYAGEYTSERTVTVVELPSDEMKGKIIGREGRNIRTLEGLCGVDLIIDDTPESVVVSSFDPLRRELARRTLNKLIEDGRVHPARIEEVVDKVRLELNKSMKEEGEKAFVELGLTVPHQEVLKAIGSLKYRHTHSQNSFVQAMEVAYLSGLIAGELGASVKNARRCGLFHNIGLAVDHMAEGHSAVAGSEFLKRFNEPDFVVQAVRSLAGDEKSGQSLMALIVQTAHALSTSRPGARRPSLDSFFQRLSDMESIANSFDGVVKCFAVQAGREVRVLVDAGKVTDDMSVMLSKDIVKKIERELPHAAQLKVNVIRETRAVDYAR